MYCQKAKIEGFVLDENNKTIENVNISFGKTSVSTSEKGFYSIEVPANKKITLTYTHSSLKKVVANFELAPNEVFEFNVVMSNKIEQMPPVVITSKNRNRIEGITNIDPAAIIRTPGPNPGIENFIKTVIGSGNNEMSSGYNVRGGNFDENLVYVNDVEIYRPFLIRSGQQEGLSFTNSEMVSNVSFSAGGFQAKYGDKMSSVLDINYRRPDKFAAAIDANFMGGSLTVESASKDKKWAAMAGVRYRDNSLLVNSQETSSNFRPAFADVQTFVVYKPNDKWEHTFLGNIAQNKYDYQPLYRQTNFGTIDEPIALVVNYQGQEKDKYTTYFGATKSTFTKDNLTLKFIGSLYHTQEQEYFDIFANYGFGQLDSNNTTGLGTVKYVTQIGAELSHARNNLDALIMNAEIKGEINNPKKNGEANKNRFEFGIKYTKEDIRDRIVEYNVVDSAGFSLNPPIKTLPNNQQPYIPYYGPLTPYQYTRATNYVNINRFSGYLQWSRKDKIGKNDIWYNLGVRAHNWTVAGDNLTSNTQTVFSPRAQITFIPKSDKYDLIFRLSGGLYHQPPFYRELRDYNGTVQPTVKAQQSAHLVFGTDYNFKLNDKPFKLVAELYYKSMTDVNTYTIDNVRIRYEANNDAKAFAQGFDLRLNGDFIKNKNYVTESWISFGYMKTEENQSNQGYIARPTDQRLKFGILFQDYMPKIPSVKIYLNMVYNTGLPGGSPAYSDPYLYQVRLKDYRRADVGFSYLFTEDNDKRPDGHWLKRFKELSLGFEIFNMFNNQNAITNTWVRDVYTKTQYGIPNYLSTRVFNLKFTARI